MKYSMTELMLLAVGKPKTDTTAVTASPTTFGELMQALEIIPRQTHMGQMSS
jgi:hypothetical protein